MKLQPHSFNKIKNGQKNIEVRLYDEKRKKISLGDIITFWLQPDLKKNIKVEVVGLLNYPTFTDLVNDFPAKNFGHPNKKNLLKTIYTFYTKKQEKEYTVLGIKIK